MQQRVSPDEIDRISQQLHDYLEIVKTIVKIRSSTSNYDGSTQILLLCEKNLELIAAG